MNYRDTARSIQCIMDDEGLSYAAVVERMQVAFADFAAVREAFDVLEAGDMADAALFKKYEQREQERLDRAHDERQNWRGEGEGD